MENRQHIPQKFQSEEKGKENVYTVTFLLKYGESRQVECVKSD